MVCKTGTERRGTSSKASRKGDERTAVVMRQSVGFWKVGSLVLPKFRLYKRRSWPLTRNCSGVLGLEKGIAFRHRELMGVEEV